MKRCRKGAQNNPSYSRVEKGWYIMRGYLYVLVFLTVVGGILAVVILGS